MRTCLLMKEIFQTSSCMSCRRDFCCVAWLHMIRSPSLDQLCYIRLQHAAVAEFFLSDRWSLLVNSPPCFERTSPL